MDKLKEMLDQFRDAFMVRWDQFQDTDTYITLREKYDNLPQRGQKAVVFSGFFLAFLLVFSIPYAWFSASQTSVVEFEDTKNTIGELLEVSQEIKTIPAASMGITPGDLKTRVEKILGEKGLSKEQITSINQTQFTNPQGSQLIPAQITASGVETNLKQLTLKQIVDIGYELDRISPLVKVLNLEMKAAESDPHYYDVQFRVSSFGVKEAETQAPARKSRR